MGGSPASGWRSEPGCGHRETFMISSGHSTGPWKAARIIMDREMRNPDLQREHYDRIYQATLSRETPARPPGDLKRHFVERFLNRSLPEGNPKTLEIGCGDGTLTNYLLSRGLSVDAVDISPVAIATLKERFPGHFASGSLTAWSGDALEHLRVCDEKYDVIIGSGIIHHIEKDGREGFFSAVFKALRPGGAFACAPEPNADGLYFYLWHLAGWIYAKFYHIEYDMEVEKGTLEMRSGGLLRDLERAGFHRPEVLPYQVLPHFSLRFLSRIDRRLVDLVPGTRALYTIISARRA
jgi:2-polyprenyl-3-methyl-5-hydroxy-6-metoxy-1,4-benzoquinol methylase